MNKSKIVSCGEHEAIPCIVMPPFMSSGMVGAFSKRPGNACIGFELYPEYVIIAIKLVANICFE